MTLESQAYKEKIDKLELAILKTFVHQRTLFRK